MSASVVVCLLMLTSVAYCHDVKLENLAFGLFRNSGKSDLMSNIRKISNSFWN